MREISFRVWDKFLFVMHYQYEYEREILIAGGYSFGEILPMKERFEFMQFTGLLDKNGKKIFESDLVKDDDGLVAEVVWIVPGFLLEIKDHGPFSLNDFGNLEVIGNIYENPELVKP